MYLCTFSEEGELEVPYSAKKKKTKSNPHPLGGGWGVDPTVMNLNLIHDISFAHFSLPWQGLKAGTKKQKYDKISEKKMLTPFEVLEIPF